MMQNIGFKNPLVFLCQILISGCFCHIKTVDIFHVLDCTKHIIIDSVMLIKHRNLFVRSPVRWFSSHVSTFPALAGLIAALSRG